MLKRLFLILFFISLFFSCKEKSGYQIILKLSDLEAQNLYAVFEAADQKSVDTLVYDGSPNLMINQTKEEFRTLTLYLENQTPLTTIYLEPQKKISVTGDAGHPYAIQIKGGKINNQLSEFRKKVAPLLKEQWSLLTSETNREYNSDKGEYISRLANINHELQLEAELFIKKNYSDEASAILIREFFSDPDMPGKIDELLSELDPKLDDFYIVEDLKTFSKKAKETIVGAHIPSFHVRNIYGKVFTEKSFSNRHFIIAFTALWCDMCQTEELLLDEISASYPVEELEILLISLDEEPEEVRELIKNDSIKWNIVTDSAGQAINMFDLFNVKAIPKSFLINAEGIIVLKTENGNELKHTLNELI